MITRISDDFVYIFDPYYLPEDYYKDDADVSIVLFNDFTHNRLVSLGRLNSENKSDFSLMKKGKREVILINRTDLC